MQRVLSQANFFLEPRLHLLRSLLIGVGPDDAIESFFGVLFEFVLYPMNFKPGYIGLLLGLHFRLAPRDPDWKRCFKIGFVQLGWQHVGMLFLGAR